MTNNNLERVAWVSEMDCESERRVRIMELMRSGMSEAEARNVVDATDACVAELRKAGKLVMRAIRDATQASMPGLIVPNWRSYVAEAAAAIAAYEAEAGERERVLAAMIEQHIVSYRQKMNDEKNEPALRYMASGAFEALRNLRAALNTTAGEGEVG